MRMQSFKIKKGSWDTRVRTDIRTDKTFIEEVKNQLKRTQELHKRKSYLKIENSLVSHYIHR